MAFITIAPSVINDHAAAEGVDLARAAQIVVSVPPPMMRALAQFGSQGINSQDDWVAQFPALRKLAENEQRLVIRMAMDGIGGVVIDDGADAIKVAVSARNKVGIANSLPGSATGGELVRA